MKALIFAILGAAGAVLYWRYTVSVDPLFRLADWSTATLDGFIYAAAGFVGGWVLGFAFGKIGHHDL